MDHSHSWWRVILNFVNDPTRACLSEDGPRQGEDRLRITAECRDHSLVFRTHGKSNLEIANSDQTMVQTVALETRWIFRLYDLRHTFAALLWSTHQREYDCYYAAGHDAVLRGPLENPIRVMRSKYLGSSCRMLSPGSIWSLRRT